MEQEAQSMKGYHFYAMLSRMKYINRWGLMRNTREENICEHSLEVAMIAHSLAVLKNQRFGGRVNPERAALLGLFHDAAEIITGDLPTPVKYFNSETRVFGFTTTPLPITLSLSLLKIPDGINCKW